MQLSGVCLLILATWVTSNPLLPEPPFIPAPEPQIFFNRNSPKAMEDYLLPTDIIPIHYDVYLVPFIEESNMTFNGLVEIDILIARQTNVIKLHAKDMEIDIDSISIALTGNDTIQNPTKVILSDDDKNFLTLEFSEQFSLGARLTLSISYVGILNNALDGFYRSSYVNAAGETKWLATTQFEPTGARRAFPCWDEPIFKATFNINIAHDIQTHPTVLSNMDGIDGNEIEFEEISAPESFVWKTFDETVVMSTYLVAFVVCDFDSFSTDATPEYRDWARPDLVAYANYSNSQVDGTLTVMEEYTGIEYALPKMDQIGIPDFAAGAMENWGLVTYREAALLWKEGTSSISSKMGVSSIIAHELAHQWFGNLVSPKWWSHIWLNEGFATYFTYNIMEAMHNDWHIRYNQVFESYAAFAVDGRENSHPIYMEADSPQSIGYLFDTITYSKGSCLIRMMVNFLEDEVFQAGIQAYLEDRKYNNADKEDLWRWLQSVVTEEMKLPADMATIMDTWTEQAGFPVITVIRNSDGKSATVTQQRFLTLPSQTPHPETWWVPLTWTFGNESNFGTYGKILTQYWLSEKEAELTGLPENDVWVIFNLQQVGYYRVNYDVQNWNLLIKALNSDNKGGIRVVNRAQLMDDAMALARASRLEYFVALETTDYLHNETEYTPLAAGFGALSYIYDRLANEEEERNMFEVYLELEKMQQEYGLEKLVATSEKLGGVNENDDVNEFDLGRTKPLVMGWNCKLEQEECNNHSSVLFKEWMASEKPEEFTGIDPNMKTVVYCAGMRSGDTAEYNFLLNRYSLAERKPGETSIIISALGCSQNETILKDYLSLSLDSTKIRTQDSRSVLASVYNNYVGVNLALDFLITNYNACAEAYGSFGAVGSAFTGLANKLNTESDRDQLATFRDDNEEQLEMDGVLPALDAAIETVDEILQWHSDHHVTVVSYFRSKTDSGVGRLASISPLLLIALSFFLNLRRT